MSIAAACENRISERVMNIAGPVLKLYGAYASKIPMIKAALFAWALLDIYQWRFPNMPNVSKTTRRKGERE